MRDTYHFELESSPGKYSGQPGEDARHDASLDLGNISESEVYMNNGVRAIRSLPVTFRSSAFAEYLRHLRQLRRHTTPESHAHHRSRPDSLDVSPPSTEHTQPSTDHTQASNSSAQTTSASSPQYTIATYAFAQRILLNANARWSVNVDNLVECVRHHPNREHPQYQDPMPPPPPVSTAADASAQCAMRSCMPGGISSTYISLSIDLCPACARSSVALGLGLVVRELIG
jgi:hypothetical protein